MNLTEDDVAARAELLKLLEDTICPHVGETVVATETGFLITFPYVTSTYGELDLKSTTEPGYTHILSTWALTLGLPVPTMTYEHRQADDALLVRITY